MKVIGNYSLETLIGEEADVTTLPNAIVNIIQLSDGNDEIREQLDIMRGWFNTLENGEPMLMKAYNSAQEQCRNYIIENKLLPRFTYRKDDFLNTNEPYEYVFSYLINSDRFEHERQIEAMAEEAKAAKFSGFKKKYKLFCEKQRMVCAEDAGESSHPTHFPNQPIELEAGSWICDAEGVRSIGFGYSDVACCHPIMPVERLVNIDTGEEKIKIAFFKFKRWREITVSKEVVAVASKITQLAANGVAVTSENSKPLVRYLCDIENMNIEIIPEKESVGRLGYVEGGFSPYVDDLIFDGDAAYKSIFEAISNKKGKFETWVEEVRKCRSESLAARIMISASFASPLVSMVGGLPFFVHMWSSESGTGKTVALMVAASVWGNPEPGTYIQSFNSTTVGHEKMAAFLNSIPMCIDELQLSKDSHGNSRFDVYQLAQGVGRTRGNKNGGVEKTPTWKNTILTTGETPIVNDGAGAGAVNRVIDLEVPIGEKVVMDGQRTANTVKQNYGHAGEKFVAALDPAEVNQIYGMYFETLSKGETTEKQSMAAALILTADALVSRMFFSEEPLAVDEIQKFLKSKSSVSVGERGYQYMCDWVAINIRFFIGKANADVPTRTLGLIGGCGNGTQDDELSDIGYVYINGTIFRTAAEEGGFNSRALLSFLKSKGLIKYRGKRYTKGKNINGTNTECVCLKLPDDDVALNEENEPELID